MPEDSSACGLELPDHRISAHAGASLDHVILPQGKERVDALAAAEQHEGEGFVGVCDAEHLAAGDLGGHHLHVVEGGDGESRCRDGCELLVWCGRLQI